MATVWDIQQAADAAVRERMPGADVFVEDIIPPDAGGWAAVAAWWTEDSYKYLRIPFTHDDATGVVALADPSETTEVGRRTEYVTMAAASGRVVRFEAFEFDDKTYEVRGVEIMRIGKHRDGDMPIDASWIDRAVSTFTRFKQAYDYLPAVIVGHTVKDTDELPAVGFLDRLRKVGDALVADIVRVPAEMFHRLKRGEFPYRSLEFYYKTAEILRCALLARAPEIKTAPLVAPEYHTMFAGGSDDAGFAVFQPNGAMEVRTMPNEFKQTPEASEDLVRLQRENAEKDAKIAEQGEALKTQGEQIAKFAAEQRRKDIRAGIASLNVVPGVFEDPEVSRFIDSVATTDSVVKFSVDGKDTEQPIGEAFVSAVGSLVKLAAAGSLVKDPRETANSGAADVKPLDDGKPEGGGDDELTEFQRSERVLTDRAHEIEAERKISFGEALNLARAERKAAA